MSFELFESITLWQFGRQRIPDLWPVQQHQNTDPHSVPCMSDSTRPSVWWAESAWAGFGDIHCTFIVGRVAQFNLSLTSQDSTIDSESAVSPTCEGMIHWQIVFHFHPHAVFTGSCYLSTIPSPVGSHTWTTYKSRSEPVQAEQLEVGSPNLFILWQCHL